MLESEQTGNLRQELGENPSVCSLKTNKQTSRSTQRTQSRPQKGDTTPCIVRPYGDDVTVLGDYFLITRTFRSPLTFSHRRSNQPFSDLRYVSHNFSVYDSEKMSSVRVSQTAVGLFQEPISSALVSYRKPDQLPIILFSLLLARRGPHQTDEVGARGFTLRKQKPTHTMPHRGAPGSNPSTQGARVRSFCQRRP